MYMILYLILLIIIEFKIWYMWIHFWSCNFISKIKRVSTLMFKTEVNDLNVKDKYIYHRCTIWNISAWCLLSYYYHFFQTCPRYRFHLKHQTLMFWEPLQVPPSGYSACLIYPEYNNCNGSTTSVFNL